MAEMFDGLPFPIRSTHPIYIGDRRSLQEPGTEIDPIRLLHDARDDARRLRGLVDLHHKKSRGGTKVSPKAAGLLAEIRCDMQTLDDVLSYLCDALTGR